MQSVLPVYIDMPEPENIADFLSTKDGIGEGSTRQALASPFTMTKKFHMTNYAIKTWQKGIRIRIDTLIVLGRDLFRQGVYPPVNILMSLSRMKDGIGEGSTRVQNYDSYSRALRALAGIVGKAGLTDIDLKYMAAGDSFEKKFLAQSLDENRTIEETLGILWDTASKLPRGELTKVKDKHIDKFFKGA